MWGLDPGSINYGVPLHREWYRRTIAHNTVTVDGALQAGKDGQSDQWKTGGGATTITASEASVYPGVQLVRTVTVRGNRIEDRFECTSNAEHTYDWAFHAPGRLTTSLELKPGPERIAATNGYQHVESVASGRAAGDFWARWEAGPAPFTLRIKGAEGTEVFTGAAPGKNAADRVPLLIIRRGWPNVVFDAVHEFA